MKRVYVDDSIRGIIKQYPCLERFLTKDRNGFYAHEVNDFMGYHLVDAGDSCRASQINIILDKLLEE